MENWKKCLVVTHSQELNAMCVLLVKATFCFITEDIVLLENFFCPCLYVIRQQEETEFDFQNESELSVEKF